MEDKQTIFIDEIIDSKIPNKYGIILDSNIFYQLWDNKKEYNEIKNYISNIIISRLKNYLVPNTELFWTLNIETEKGKKILKLTEETILNNLLIYINAADNILDLEQKRDYLFPILHYHTIEEKQEYLKEYRRIVKEKIKQKIKELRQAEHIDDIKYISPIIYDFLSYKIKRNPDKFKQYIEKISDALLKLNVWLNDEIKEITKPIDINLIKNINKDKLKLYICKQYLEYVKIAEYKEKIILLDYINKNIKSLTQKELELNNILINQKKGLIPYREENSMKIYGNVIYDKYTSKDLEKEFTEYLEQNPEIKEKLDKLSDYNKEDFSNLNYDEIIEYVDMILADEEIKKEIEIIEENDLISELSTINKELEDDTLSNESKNKLNSQKQKLEFLLKECKPHKLCKGIKTFEGYYGYIYPNGIIVFDKLDLDFNKSYGHAIYMMPIEKIKDYSGLSLSELRKKIKEEAIKDADYKYHTGNWKEEIKKIINKTPHKEIEHNIQIEEIELPFDIKELDKITEKLEKTEETESKKILKDKIEKQKNIIIKSKEIDVKLKNNSPQTELTNLDRKEIDTEEQDLSKKDYKTFIELFESWLKNNKKEKVKRNPVVSLYTKDRTRDEEGNYHCELCNCGGFSTMDFETHHFIPISKNGPDNIYNTVCLCPNCHTNVHNNKITYNQKYNLLMKIKENIIKYNPEYIEEFNYYFDEMLNIYKKTLDSIESLEEEKEYYKKHKEQIEELFNIYYIGNNVNQKNK